MNLPDTLAELVELEEDLARVAKRSNDELEQVRIAIRRKMEVGRTEKLTKEINLGTQALT